LPSIEANPLVVLVRVPVPDGALAELEAKFPNVELVDAIDQNVYRSRLAEASAILSSRVPATDIEAAPRLKWIHAISAGVDSTINQTMIDRGIVLTNNSGVHVPNIAEHIMAMVLAFARAMPFHMRGQLKHQWTHDLPGRQVFELRDQTMLIVGYGDIGQSLGGFAHAFGMNVIGVRRRKPAADDGVARVIGLDELKANVPLADHVAICLPLTPATRGLFDRETLTSMKRGAYIYNIGRGTIIDQDTMIELLTSGHLGGAGLDVTTPEPLGPESPLWDLENVIITGHTSGQTPRHWEKAGAIFEANLRRFIAGDPLINVIDYAAGY
jgi:phosphoglycerate dehydrogenase-like enzyme